MKMFHSRMRRWRGRSSSFPEFSLAHQESIFESLWKIGVPGKHHRARRGMLIVWQRVSIPSLSPVIVDESKSGRRRRRRGVAWRARDDPSSTAACVRSTFARFMSESRRLVTAAAAALKIGGAAAAVSKSGHRAKRGWPIRAIIGALVGGCRAKEASTSEVCTCSRTRVTKRQRARAKGAQFVT